MDDVEEGGGWRGPLVVSKVRCERKGERDEGAKGCEDRSVGKEVIRAATWKLCGPRCEKTKSQANAPSCTPKEVLHGVQQTAASRSVVS